MKGKKKLFLVTVMLVLFMTGCGNKDTEGKTEEDISGGDNIIRWVTGSLQEIPQSHVDELNRLLKEKGYDCSVQFEYYGDEYEKSYGENGKELVLEYVKNHDVDIMFSGYTYGTDAPIYTLIDEGMAEPLSPYLETEQGKRLKEAYHENIWKASEYKGEAYYIPNAYIGTFQEFYIEFNPDYVSEDEVKRYDGTMKSMRELVRSKGHPFYWNQWNSNMLYYTGYSKCTMDFGTWISNEEKRADVSYIEALYDDTKIQNEMYLSGELYYNQDYENLVPPNKADYLAWIGYGIVDEDNRYIYAYGKDTTINMAGSATLICSKSKKKELAFDVLVEILLDEKLSNAVLYGVEGKDYELVDGVVQPLEGVSLDGYNYYTIADETGCYLKTYNNPLDEFSVSREEKCRIFWEELSNSPLLGFNFDYSDCVEGRKITLEAYRHNNYPDIGSETFDEDWNRFIKMHKTPEAQAMYDELNRQLEEFFEGKD